MNDHALKIFHSLHPKGRAFKYQTDWVQDESKYKLGVKARQIGITTTEAYYRFLQCYSWQESQKYPLPHVIIFASPSARQSSRLMEYVQRARRQFEKIYKTRVEFKKEREDYCLLDNGCEIWSLPNSPRTIEGIDGSQGIIDEAANFAGHEDEEVYQALMGSLGAKGGGVTLFGRPRGRRGLYWKLRDPYGEFSKHFSVHEFPWTVRAEEDPVYKSTVEDQRLRMPNLAFAEQYECQFIDENILLFPYGILDRQKRPYKLWAEDDEADTAAPLYMGIDFAKKLNETVVTITEHASPSKIRLQLTSKKSYDIQIPWICNLIDHFKPLKCWVDETSLGIPLLDMLKAKFASRVEGVHFGVQNKEKLLMNLKAMLEDNKLIIPDQKDLLDQLHGMEKIVMDSGNIKYTGKRSETDWLDDRVWSLALSVFDLGAGDFTMTMTDTAQEVQRIDDYKLWLRDEDEQGNPL